MYSYSSPFERFHLNLKAMISTVDSVQCLEIKTPLHQWQTSTVNVTVKGKCLSPSSLLQ